VDLAPLSGVKKALPVVRMHEAPAIHRGSRLVADAQLASENCASGPLLDEVAERAHLRAPVLLPSSCVCAPRTRNYVWYNRLVNAERTAVPLPLYGGARATPMENLPLRLKRAREHAKFSSATEAAEKNGWNANTYRSIENGTRRPGFVNAIEYADAFGVSLNWLLTGRGQMIEGPYKEIPVYALKDLPGKTNYPRRPIAIRAEPKSHVVVPNHHHSSRRTFSIEVEGHAMVDNAGSIHSLFPGDVAIIDPEAEIYPGCIALAEIGNEFCLRKVQIRKPGKPGKRPLQVALVPLNSDHHTEIVDGSAIVGVMIGMYRTPPGP